MRRWRAAAVALLAMAAGCAGLRGVVTSPINGRQLELPRESAHYRFIMTGHAYGSQNESVYPSASVLANLDLFNREDLAFVMLLGDIVRGVNDASLAAFDGSFASRVRRPMFNAIGNHDDDGKGRYRERFGKTFYSFQYSSELFIVVDGEAAFGDVRDEQLGFLVAEIRRARESPEVRNLFLFSHRLLWAIGNPEFAGVIPLVNGPEDHAGPTSSFTLRILPELRQLPGKSVYLVAGDVGGSWSFPLFYQKDEAADITYIATGIGDHLDDTVLIAAVDGGVVSFEAVALSPHGRFAVRPGQAPPPLETYSGAYWRNQRRPHE